MLHEALGYIANDLNGFLKRKYSLQEDKVVLGSILDEAGSVPEGNMNKIILSMINLEYETNMAHSINGVRKGGVWSQSNPPLNFNVDMMFSGLFNQYPESLKFISDTIYFFQAKPVFNPQNSPGLDERIDSLKLEVLDMDYNEMHNLWTSLAAKYIPSIGFKMRLLSFQADQVQDIYSLINTTGQETVPGL